MRGDARDRPRLVHRAQGGSAVLACGDQRKGIDVSVCFVREEARWVWAKIKPPGDRRFSPWFHLPGSQNGCLFLTHSYMPFGGGLMTRCGLGPFTWVPNRQKLWVPVSRTRKLRPCKGSGMPVPAGVSFERSLSTLPAPAFGPLALCESLWPFGEPNFSAMHMSMACHCLECYLGANGGRLDSQPFGFATTCLYPDQTPSNPPPPKSFLSDRASHGTQEIRAQASTPFPREALTGACTCQWWTERSRQAHKICSDDGFVVFFCWSWYPFRLV